MSEDYFSRPNPDWGYAQQTFIRHWFHTSERMARAMNPWLLMHDWMELMDTMRLSQEAKGDADSRRGE